MPSAPGNVPNITNALGGQASVTATPVALGGTLQGQVASEWTNQGATDCYLWFTTDGSTPTQATILANGRLLAAGADSNSQGIVMSTGIGGTVAPQWFACTQSGSTTVAWTERIAYSGMLGS